MVFSTASGCDGCRRGEKTERARARASAKAPRCSAVTDCANGEPCTQWDCVNEECIASPAAAGTSCDNDTVCDGLARCNADGRCIRGAAPAIDDGNGCTVDACDPVKGVRHEPAPIDDFDVCTEDACDPATGQIAHMSVKIDDGNDCTFDTCDAKTGVKHQQANPFHTCQPQCGAGFHAATRTPSAECGASQALRTYCTPSCGSSFYACASSCPEGYHSVSRTLNPRCGAQSPQQAFCQKTQGDSFHTCDERCPQGYELRSQTKGGQCGDSPVMSFCSKA